MLKHGIKTGKGESKMQPMYHMHPLLTTPQDETKLWRYIDLSQFLWLLFNQSIYFARVVEFDDKWEGKLPLGSIEALRNSSEFRELVKSGQVPEDLGLRVFKFGLKHSQALFGVSCWHKNEVESVAMWALYTRGKDGVAIQTTVDRLKTCLSHDPRRIFIAQVSYLDHEAPPNEGSISFDAVLPIMTKRRSYKHESEVRLIVERFQAKSQEEYDEFIATVSRGETILVNTATLIQRIVVAPDYPAWAIKSLQQLVTAAGLSVEVEPSDLLKLPESDDPPMAQPTDHEKGV